MTRIFTVLASLNGLILLLTFAGGTGFKLGLGLPYLVHFSLGLLSAITTLLVHCAIFTYFLGTGRWVKEVAIAYRIPDEPLPKLTRELKRDFKVVKTLKPKASRPESREIYLLARSFGM